MGAHPCDPFGQKRAGDALPALAGRGGQIDDLQRSHPAVPVEYDSADDRLLPAGEHDERLRHRPGGAYAVENRRERLPFVGIGESRKVDALFEEGEAREVFLHRIPVGDKQQFHHR